MALPGYTFLTGNNAIGTTYSTDAISFNGTNSTITYDSEFVENGVTAFTITAWINNDRAFGSDVTEAVLAFDASYQYTFGIEPETDTSASYVFLNAPGFGNNSEAESNGWTTTGEWVFIGVSVNYTTETARFCVNDTGSTTGSSNFVTWGSSSGSAMDRLIIGRNFLTHYDGCLADVQYRREFTDFTDTSHRRRYITEGLKPVAHDITGTTFNSGRDVILKGNSSSWTQTGRSIGTQTLNNITNCGDSPSD
jgi:ribosomal protein S18